jgi:hypothetical protein
LDSSKLGGTVGSDLIWFTHGLAVCHKCSVKD